MNNRIILPVLTAAAILLSCACLCCHIAYAEPASGMTVEPYIGVTLVPPGKITDQVSLDIRIGLVNGLGHRQKYRISARMEPGGKVVLRTKTTLKAGDSSLDVYSIDTKGLDGRYTLEVQINGHKILKQFEVVPSGIRSDRTIDGAWAGLYHWSEVEGKHWNADIRKMTDGQWRTMMKSMHSIGMDLVVIQEAFRNQAYVGDAVDQPGAIENYAGRAFYPSRLYPGRMPIIAQDPIEAILSEADSLGMNVMLGVGMYAWFDFTSESLNWHQKVARELWDMYGRHTSFYGFYISEESGGNLYTIAKNDSEKKLRQGQIVDFFRQFDQSVMDYAPDKPVMLATNCMDIMQAKDVYPSLLEYLDILCPFGFARMPEGDLTGKAAADTLQKWCDVAGTHLWMDLEAFLFNPDKSLYPRPIEGIIHDLTLFDNFEKVLCYQFPGVFNAPEQGFRIGEPRTVDLYRDYADYLKNLK